MARSFIESALERIGEQRYSEALRILKRGLKRMPAGWRPIEQRGESLQCAFWSAQEFAEFSRVCDPGVPVMWVTPSFSQAWYWIAHCKWEMNKWEEAQNAINEAIRLEPDHPEALCEAGYFVQESQMYSDALELYRRAYSCRKWLTPEQKGLALRGQGYCLIELWQFDEAAAVLLDSLHHEPGNLVAMGELAFLQKRREEVERREGLTPEERARIYPPTSTEAREMLRFAAGVPPSPGMRTVGRENYARIREAFERIGWLGFEAEFICIYPHKDAETQARKARLMRDPVFRAAYVPEPDDAFGNLSTAGTAEAQARLKRMLQ